MLRTLLYLLLLTTLFSSLAHAGIGYDMVEWLAPDADLAGVRQVELHSVINGTGKNFDFDVATAATQALQQRLSDAGMKITAPGGPIPQKIVIKTSIVYYQSGSVGDRWIGLGGGAAICILRTQLIDGRSDRLLGDMTAAYEVQVGGLFTIGAHKYVPKAAAEMIADRILKLTGLEASVNETD